jgi:hypothetical protein
MYRSFIPCAIEVALLTCCALALALGDNLAAVVVDLLVYLAGYLA